MVVELDWAPPLVGVTCCVFVGAVTGVVGAGDVAFEDAMVVVVGTEEVVDWTPVAEAATAAAKACDWSRCSAGMLPFCNSWTLFMCLSDCI